MPMLMYYFCLKFSRSYLFRISPCKDTKKNPHTQTFNKKIIKIISFACKIRRIGVKKRELSLSQQLS